MEIFRAKLFYRQLNLLFSRSPVIYKTMQRILIGSVNHLGLPSKLHWQLHFFALAYERWITELLMFHN